MRKCFKISLQSEFLGYFLHTLEGERREKPRSEKEKIRDCDG